MKVVFVEPMSSVEYLPISNSASPFRSLGGTCAAGGVFVDCIDCRGVIRGERAELAVYKGIESN